MQPITHKSSFLPTLTETELFQQAPSIFALQACSGTSSKYAFIPTIECIRSLQKEGFNPVKVLESKCRSEDNRPFSKHMIRFRKEGTLEVGGNFPEIVLINSHNGLSSYQLKAGIYRLVCANGLVVGNDLFCRSVRHQGDAISKVVEAAGEIIEVIPEVIEIAEQWKNIRLDQHQRRIYANSAALLKWDPEEIEIDPESLLRPRRFQDRSDDLWTTFNALQENVIRGGVRYRNKDSSAVRRRGSTRAVNAVSENTRLNTALWSLTEKMAVLVTERGQL